MLHAHVTSGAIDFGPALLPSQWREPDTGTLFTGLRHWPLSELKAKGWLPVSEINAAFDPALQVRTGPTLKVRTSRVTATYSVRDKTAAEIDQEKGAEAVHELDGRKVMQLVAQVLHDQENRLRQLEGKPAVTKAEYRTSLIATFKGL